MTATWRPSEDLRLAFIMGIEYTIMSLAPPESGGAAIV